MSARGELENALHRWCWAMDERDLDEVRDCWTADAILTSELPGREPTETTGRDAILERLQAAWGRSPLSGVKHVVTTVHVERETADEARVRTYVVSLRLVDGRPALSSVGRHQDELTRQDGVWRIRRRHQRIDGWMGG
jgi:ketosteroid isomerase-like protein